MFSELVHRILIYTDKDEWMTTALVCKEWYELSMDLYWRTLYCNLIDLNGQPMVEEVHQHVMTLISLDKSPCKRVKAIHAMLLHESCMPSPEFSEQVPLVCDLVRLVPHMSTLHVAMAGFGSLQEGEYLYRMVGEEMLDRLPRLREFHLREWCDMVDPDWLMARNAVLDKYILPRLNGKSLTSLALSWLTPVTEWTLVLQRSLTTLELSVTRAVELVTLLDRIAEASMDRLTDLKLELSSGYDPQSDTTIDSSAEFLRAFQRMTRSCSQLETLEAIALSNFSSLNVSLWSFLQVVSTCSRLKSLCITDMLFAPVTQPPTIPLCFTRLESMEVRVYRGLEDGWHGGLSTFVWPRLRTMDMPSSGWRADTLATLLDHAPHLQHVTVSFTSLLEAAYIRMLVMLMAKPRPYITQLVLLMLKTQMVSMTHISRLQHCYPHAIIHIKTKRNRAFYGCGLVTKRTL